MIRAFQFVSLLLITLYQVSAVAQESRFYKKINGISIWSDEAKRSVQDFNFVEESGAQWVSFQPFGVVRTDSTGVDYDLDSVWECSSIAGLASNIQIAKDLGYSVFLKPHVILKYHKPGVWVGDMKLGKEAHWDTMKSSYQEYIVRLAKLADSLEVDMFALGTEVKQLPVEHPFYWHELIDTVRSIYSGRLTYCANFDAYEEYPFWKEMDVIGVDAYFSIDRSKNARLNNCRENWKEIAADLEELSSRMNKKILFAEFGYMSADQCAFRPFEQQSANVNLVAQANAYRAVFDTFWHQPWFAGGFSWVWRFDNDQPENYDNTLYTPQNKPAAAIIRKYFEQYD